METIIPGYHKYEVYTVYRLRESKVLIDHYYISRQQNRNQMPLDPPIDRNITPFQMKQIKGYQYRVLDNHQHKCDQDA